MSSHENISSSTRAGCGKSARPVRRGGGGIIPSSLLYRLVHAFNIIYDIKVVCIEVVPVRVHS
jgi:hypothetical protein